MSLPTIYKALNAPSVQNQILIYPLLFSYTPASGTHVSHPSPRHPPIYLPLAQLHPQPHLHYAPLTKLLYSIFLTFLFFTAVAIATPIAVVLAVILASISFCAFSTALVFAGIGRIKDWQRDPRQNDYGEGDVFSGFEKEGRGEDYRDGAMLHGEDGGGSSEDGARLGKWNDGCGPEVLPAQRA